MNEEILIKAIRDEISLLEKWAQESKVGGWSTHQVEPQLKRANELKILLFDLKK
jgi:hypothetical protein